MNINKKRVVTLPLLGERAKDGKKLQRKLRHKNLKKYYTLVGNKLPWQSKLKHIA